MSALGVVRLRPPDQVVELLGDRVWWPATARGGAPALREYAEEPVAEPA